MSQAANTSSEQVTITLNGKKVSGAKGSTVMEIAKNENVDIPHFCWHPGLSIAGVCRFCLVKVEGARKLEIACNLTATEGMIVSTLDPEVKEAHKWALEFHLVNHPLDCPICDQAGECGLQDFYMSVGKYQSQMVRPKALKPKALDVGGDLVLDTERCILCSRCVRFEEEVTKSFGLGIFSRGDRAIIGTYPDRKISHQYTTNLVDICPVGAFTSKDFRFKKRVWFLEDKKSVCPGCSTGCAVDVYAKPKERTYYRIKPRYSEVNNYWMCDFGRKQFSHLSHENRLLIPYEQRNQTYIPCDLNAAVSKLQNKLNSVDPSQVALLVSAQYTCEEYESIFNFFTKKHGIKNVLQWRDDVEDIKSFDGLLMRGDKNPNTSGLLAALKKFGLTSEVRNDFEKIQDKNIKMIIGFAPELPLTFPNIGKQLEQLAKLDAYTCMFTVLGSLGKIPGFDLLIPTLGFAEKNGTFKNFENKDRILEEKFNAYLLHYAKLSSVDEMFAKVTESASQVTV